MESVRRSSLRRKRQTNNEFSRLFHATRTFILNRVLERYNRLDRSPHISSSYSFDSDNESDLHMMTAELSYEFDPLLDLEYPITSTYISKENATEMGNREETLPLNRSKQYHQYSSLETYQSNEFELSDDDLSLLDLTMDDSNKQKAFARTSSFLSRDIEAITFLQILTDPFMIYCYMRLWGIRIRDMFRKGDNSLFVHVLTLFTISSSCVTLILFASHILCVLASALTACFGCYVRIQVRQRRLHKEYLEKRLALKNSIAHVSMENASLKRKVMELKANIARMKPMKSDLYNIAYDLSIEPPLLVPLINTSNDTKKMIKLRIQSLIVQNIVKAMYMSNRGKTQVVNPITMALIISKMKSIPHLNFHAERLKRAIETNGDTFLSLMRICLQQFHEMNYNDRGTCHAEDESAIFQYHP